MCTNKAAGLWIPPPILHNDDLTITEKVVLAEIVCLSRSGPCIASNQHLSDFLHMRVDTIKHIIYSLRNKDKLEIVGRQKERQLIPAVNWDYNPKEWDYNPKEWDYNPKEWDYNPKKWDYNPTENIGDNNSKYIEYREDAGAREAPHQPDGPYPAEKQPEDIECSVQSDGPYPAEKQPEDIESPVQLWEQLLYHVSPKQIGEINEMEDKFGTALVKRGIQEMVDSGKSHAEYLWAILGRWQRLINEGTEEPWKEAYSRGGYKKQGAGAKGKGRKNAGGSDDSSKWDGAVDDWNNLGNCVS